MYQLLVVVVIRVSSTTRRQATTKSVAAALTTAAHHYPRTTPTSWRRLYRPTRTTSGHCGTWSSSSTSPHTDRPTHQWLSAILHLHLRRRQLQQQSCRRHADFTDDDGQLPFFFCDRIPFLLFVPFSARCNIYISRLCYDVSVRLSVTEVHWVAVHARNTAAAPAIIRSPTNMAAADGGVISRYASHC